MKDLANAIMAQAAKDFAHTRKPQTRKAIIADLESEWMQAVTADLERNSLELAKEMRTNPKAIVNAVRNAERKEKEKEIAE